MKEKKSNTCRNIIIVIVVCAAAFCLITGLRICYNAPGDGVGGYISKVIFQKKREISESSPLGFQYYHGPISPLTTDGQTADSVQADRNVKIDFVNPYDGPEGIEFHNENAAAYESIADVYAVTDTYLITNTSREDVTAGFYYPFYTNLCIDGMTYPVLTADGVQLEAELIRGMYVEDTTNTTYNCYSDIKEIFGTSDYLERSINIADQLDPEESEYLRTYYDYTINIVPDPSVPADQIEVELVYNIFDTERDVPDVDTDEKFSSRYVNKEEMRQYDRFDYTSLDSGVLNLQVTYGELENLQINAYQITQDFFEDGSYGNVKKEIACEWSEEHTCTDQAEQMKDQILELYPRMKEEYGIPDDYSAEKLALAVQDDLITNWNGYSSYEMAFDGEVSMEDWIRIIILRNTVMFERVEVTIPAGGTVDLTACYDKTVSHTEDYGENCSTGKILDNGTRDPVTWRCVEISRELGSNLNFSSVTAEVKLADDMTVRSDNMTADSDNKTAGSDNKTAGSDNKSAGGDNMLSKTGEAVSLDNPYSYFCYVTKAQQETWH